MSRASQVAFDQASLLGVLNSDSMRLRYSPGAVIFAQGDEASAVFYIERGRREEQLHLSKRQGEDHRHSQREGVLRYRMHYGIHAPADDSGGNYGLCSPSDRESFDDRHRVQRP